MNQDRVNPGNGRPAAETYSTVAERVAATWTPRRCVTLHGIITAIILLTYPLATPEFTLTVGGFLVGATFLFFAWVEARRTFLKVTPVSVYFIWQGFALGPAAIFVASQLLSEQIRFGVHLLSPIYIQKGYVIGVLGTLPLHLGLQWLRPKEEDAVFDPSAQEIRRLLPFLIVAFGVGCGVLLFSRYLPFLGVINGFFQFAAHGALLTFVLLPRQKLGLAESARAGVLVIGTALLLIASTGAGSKMYLMLALVGLPFYVMQNRSLRRHVPAMAIFMLFIYLTAVAPTVNESRRIQSRDKLPQSQALVEAFKRYSPLYTGKFDAEFYQEQIETLFSRQFEASSIAIITEDVDLKGFMNGETFYQLRYFLIPRLFWPEKPMMVRGGWFTSYLGNSPRETDSTTSIGMEAAGELYWNFGYLGVIVGMFVLGAMFGGIWRMTGTNPAMRPLHMTLYMLNTLTMMNLPEAGSRMVSCIYIFIFFGLIFSLMRPLHRTKTVVFSRVGFSQPA